MTTDEMVRERVNRGFSRRRLAREINVPEQTLRRAERGEGVSLQYAKRIADFYGVLVTDIWPVEEPEATAA